MKMGVFLDTMVPEEYPVFDEVHFTTWTKEGGMKFTMACMRSCRMNENLSKNEGIPNTLGTT